MPVVVNNATDLPKADARLRTFFSTFLAVRLNITGRRELRKDDEKKMIEKINEGRDEADKLDVPEGTNRDVYDGVQGLMGNTSMMGQIMIPILEKFIKWQEVAGTDAEALVALGDGDLVLQMMAYAAQPEFRSYIVDAVDFGKNIVSGPPVQQA